MASAPTSSSLKLKVRFIDNLKRDEFELMSQLNKISPLNIVDIFIATDNAVVNVSSHEEVEALLTPGANVKAKELGLYISSSPLLKSQKTIFLPRVRHFVSNSSVEDILVKINSCNAGQLEATEAVIVLGPDYKEGQRKSLRLTFKTAEMADKACTNGFSIGDFKIESKSIVKVDFVQVPQCYRCFSYSHLVKSCPATVSRCSICYGTHSYRECPTPNDPKCCVCGGGHISVSSDCPFRKEAIRNKRASVKASRRGTTAPPPQPPPRLYPAPPPQGPSPWTALPSTSTPQTPLNPAVIVPPAPQAPQPLLNPVTTVTPAPQAPQSPDPFNSSCIPQKDTNLYFSIWQSIASRMAGDDDLLYMKIFNSFLVEHTLPEFKIPKFVHDLAISRNPTSNPDLHQPSHPVSTSDPLQLSQPISTPDQHQSAPESSPPTSSSPPVKSPTPKPRSSITSENSSSYSEEDESDQETAQFADAPASPEYPVLSPPPPTTSQEFEELPSATAIENHLENHHLRSSVRREYHPNYARAGGTSRGRSRHKKKRH